MTQKIFSNIFYLITGIAIGSVCSLYLPLSIVLIICFFLVAVIIFVGWFLKQQPGSNSLSRPQNLPVTQSINIAVQQERDRIYRNLHDDIGAQLLNLVYKAPDSESADIARVILQNMREVIAKTIDKQLSLAELLGDIRTEMDNRLNGTGISLLWDVPIDIGEQPLQASQIISISRIFREGLSNAIKHSGAQNVTFMAREIDQTVSIALIDNGVGVQKQSRGRGMQSMQKRASDIKAQFSVNNLDEGGFQIELIL